MAKKRIKLMLAVMALILCVGCGNEGSKQSNDTLTQTETKTISDTKSQTEIKTTGDAMAQTEASTTNDNGGSEEATTVDKEGGEFSPEEAVEKMLMYYRNNESDKLITLIHDKEEEYVKNKLIATEEENGVVLLDQKIEQSTNLKEWFLEHYSEVHFLYQFDERDGFKWSVSKYEIGLPKKMNAYIDYFEQFDEVGTIELKRSGIVEYENIITYRVQDRWYIPLLLYAFDSPIHKYTDEGKKEEDIGAAECVNTAVMLSLALEDAYDELMNYMDGETVVAKAAPGEPFQAVGVDVNAFVTELNKNLEGNAPELLYQRKLKYGGFVPAGWAIAMSKDGKPIVYITDGGIDNKVVVQPTIAEDYK